MTLKISISGIRGIIGDGLDAESVTRYAAAFGSWLPEGPVVVGRDSRPSGPMLTASVHGALLSTGHDVIEGGILSTPGTEYLVQTTDAVGGIIITASHNPVEWNALKLLRHDSLFLSADELEAMLALAEAPSRSHRAALSMGTLHFVDDAEDRHLNAILECDFVDPVKVRAAKLHVVVDAVEGAGGRALPTLLERMGVKVTALYCDRTGIFPHDPEPRPAHLEELRQRVEQEGADLGLAVDPDVDRLAMIDKGGKALSEELTLAVATDHVLQRKKGPVVVNLSTSLSVGHVAKKHGVQLWRTPVGEANVVARMLEEGAVIGGEGNGGVILPALHPGRDALLGAAIVLSAVAERGSLSACVAELPETTMLKEKLELTPEIDDPGRWEEALGTLATGGKMDRQDGLKYDLGDRWVHLRRSNTENALRIIAEGPDEAAASALIDGVRNALGA